MKKLEDERFCELHKEKLVFLEKSKTDFKLKKLCEKCIVQKYKNIMKLDDITHQYQSLKQKILRENQVSIERNKVVFQQLKDYLQNYQGEFIEKINLISSQVQQYIDFMQKYVSMDIQNDFKIEAIQDISKWLLSQNQDIKQIKQSLQNQLKNFSLVEFLNTSKRIVEQISHRKEDSQIEFEKYLFQELQIHNQNENQLKCERHGQEISFVDLNFVETIPSRLACIDCLQQQKVKLTEINQFKQKWLSQVQQLKDTENNRQNSFQQKILRQQGFLIELGEGLQNQINSLMKQFEQFNNHKSNYYTSKEWNQFSQQDLSQLANLLAQKQGDTFFEELTSVEEENKIDQLIQNSCQQFRYLIQKFHIISLGIKVQDDISSITNSDSEKEIENDGENPKQFKYELLQYNSIQEEITASTFNIDGSLFLTGHQQGFIKVFQFKNEQLIIRQTLAFHKNCISSLNFFKNSQFFLSSSEDQKIVIWQKSSENWFKKSVLESDYGKVYCTIMNKNENLIIAGCDYTILIWNKKQNNWELQQKFNFKDEKVKSISFNSSETLLIYSSNISSQITLFSFEIVEKFWVIKETIKISQLHNCFSMNDKLFTYSVSNDDILVLQKYDDLTKQFQKMEAIQLNSKPIHQHYYPQQYLNKLQILLTIIGKTINIISVNENGSFIIQQKIKCIDDRINSRISENGQYLLTFDNGSKLLQLWKLKILIKNKT